MQVELQWVQSLMIEAQNQALQSQVPLVPTSFVPFVRPPPGLEGSKSQSQGPRTFPSQKNPKGSKRV